MIYITGDTHGDFSRFREFCAAVHPGSGDTVIILGDAGFNYSLDRRDKKRKAYMNSLGMTVFSIQGNREKRPGDVPGYRTREYCGGTVWYQEEYPRLLFAKDGEVYRFGEYDCIVIGGAYSIDKRMRSLIGRWFANEQPSDEIKAYVEKQLEDRGYRIDVVLSHTCPFRYEPTEVFLPGFDQSKVDTGTEKWLGEIEEKLGYRKWYCGHFHTEKKIDRMEFMFKNIEEFGI